MVRVRNLIDGVILPHRDFVELDTRKCYLRLFAPLEDNLSAFHSDAEGVFQMRAGEIWKLDASQDHAAANFSRRSRQFLCLDFCSESPIEIQDVFKAGLHARNERRDVSRVEFTSEDRHSLIRGISSLLEERTFRDIVFATSKIHFSRLVGTSECYDWLIEAAELVNNTSVVNKAKALKSYLTRERKLRERFSIYF